MSPAADGVACSREAKVFEIKSRRNYLNTSALIGDRPKVDFTGPNGRINGNHSPG